MAASHENVTGVESPRQGPAVPTVRDRVSQVELDATLPPTPVRDLLADSGATLCVLATDAGFVAAIRRAAGDDHPLTVVESWAELMQAVESGRCGIALLDAAMLGSRVAACVSTLAAYADRVVTLVAADRATAHEYIGFLSDGRLHRLLIKPPAPGATRLLIESATARCLQLRDELSPDDGADESVDAPRRFPKWGWAAAASVGALALIGTAIGAGGFGWWDRREPVEAVPTMSATTAMAPQGAPTAEDRIAEFRVKAELAHQEGRLAEPIADNALDHYLTVLALAPGDQAARTGVSSVVDTLFDRAEQALLNDSLAEAAAALDHVRRADSSSSRLAFLDAQLARALAALAASPPPPAVAAAVTAPAAPTSTAPSELDSALNLATARLRRGQLLNPPGDSARAYLDRAAGIGGADPRVAALRADLAAALISSARMLAGTDSAGATNLITEARRLGADAAAISAVERDVEAARARQAQDVLANRLAAAQDRIRTGALFVPSGESALDHLFRLQTDAPDLEGLAAVWDTFRQAAGASINAAIQAEQWATAEAQLARLAQAPGGEAAVLPLTAELGAARLQQTFLATATPASELTLVSSVPVVYPTQALQRGLEGWVDLEFIVDRSGRPTNIVVAQGSPPGRFDAAAVAAVEQYRYEPYTRDGRVFDRRLRLRVRFQI